MPPEQRHPCDPMGPDGRGGASGVSPLSLGAGTASLSPACCLVRGGPHMLGCAALKTRGTRSQVQDGLGGLGRPGVTLRRRDPRVPGTRPTISGRAHTSGPLGGRCREAGARRRLPGYGCQVTTVVSGAESSQQLLGQVRGTGGPTAGLLAGHEGWGLLSLAPAQPPGPLQVLWGHCPGEGRRRGRPGRLSPLQGVLMRPGPQRREKPPGRAGKGAPPDSRGDPRPRGQPTRGREAPARRTMCSRASRPPRRGAASCRSFYLTSRHVGRALRSQTDGPCRGRRAWDTKDAETALPKRGTWPHRHHGDRSQPQAEAPVQAPRRRPSPGRAGLTACPVRGLGLRAARRPRRRVGTASSQRCPRPGTPAPVRRSHTRFARRRGPTRTQAGAKRGKRSGAARAQRSCPRGPGRAHERPMGSQAEGLPHQPGRPHQDTGGLGQGQEGRRASGQATDIHPPTDEAAAAKPRAALLERHVLCGELLPGSGCGPFFYIGGSNGASIISSYCKSKGWQRIQDSRREDYRLKWCEVRCRDSYHSFREGEQLLFQLPNNKLLTTKIGLLSALREHSRAAGTLDKVALCAQARSGRDAAPALEGLTGTSPGGLGPQRVLQMDDFFPETYRLDMRDEREAFFTLFDDVDLQAHRLQPGQRHLFAQEPGGSRRPPGQDPERGERPHLPQDAVPGASGPGRAEVHPEPAAAGREEVRRARLPAHRLRRALHGLLWPWLRSPYPRPLRPSFQRPHWPLDQPVHAEEEPPLHAAEGGHGVEHGPPQPLHQRQVPEDQRPPPGLGLHRLHDADAADHGPLLLGRQVQARVQAGLLRPHRV
ncbi:inactive polyglycylase TTLL10 isoform X4 [Rousettus aegyptiacus]|uniref:inactive polyglycylase TTLL10 isoform X4 n=1 Tax=Rousettus aegyptiacus TaxID=9407 RepID=UPI00168CAF99|nr:inactive polyglycylase TTLL10 isoform X4 [Rousettus aegyptiacus]